MRVRVTGPELNLRTKRSNSKGVVMQRVKIRKAGVVAFSDREQASQHKRIGVTGVFAPPATG